MTHWNNSTNSRDLNITHINTVHRGYYSLSTALAHFWNFFQVSFLILMFISTCHSVVRSFNTCHISSPFSDTFWEQLNVCSVLLGLFSVEHLDWSDYSHFKHVLCFSWGKKHQISQSRKVVLSRAKNTWTTDYLNKMLTQNVCNKNITKLWLPETGRFKYIIHS